MLRNAPHHFYLRRVKARLRLSEAQVRGDFQEVL